MKIIRTDLAMESFDGKNASEFPGVQIRHWDQSDIRLTEVTVGDDAAAQSLGKPRGVYLTLECPLLRDRDPDARAAMSNLLGEELSRMLPDTDAPVLVVGLGNRFITPDALGALTVDRTLVTRHAAQSEWFRGELRSVSAIAPGVLGITGIETVEMIQSVTERTHPSMVICVDSLAAQASSRIGTTIQLSDAGIQPGAGVGNHRRAIDRATLGVDVLAIGMPTVVYAATLARDAFALLAQRNGEGFTDDALQGMERELLNEELGEMIVTPREIDAVVRDAADIIASGLNRALHPSLSDAEIATMMD